MWAISMLQYVPHTQNMAHHNKHYTIVFSLLISYGCLFVDFWQYGFLGILCDDCLTQLEMHCIRLRGQSITLSLT